MNNFKSQLNSVMTVLVKAQGPDTIVVTSKSSTPTGGVTVYNVIVPEGHMVTELELVTRCDNQRFNLNESMGQMLHFGGDAQLQGPAAGGNEFRVRVFNR
jgi:hypothetical protein